MIHDFVMVFHWLVEQGLYHYLLAWVVASLLTWLVARHKFRKHVAAQARIADALDTSTPGGLTDVMEAMASTASVLEDLQGKTAGKRS